MEDKSESVERFLNLLKKSKRGKFKIYIGLAAGVGKTYRMLLEAQNLKKNGVDVIIGYIETHNRAETAKLLEGLPAVPRKNIFYKGHELEELDVDAVILRRPEVAVVDELAHTNIPGSKNEKRWQDVEQILNSGISVISAVNIQHIESLNAVVERITKIEVKERVPDSVLKAADEVVNVDLTVDELLERLKEGKVYLTEKIESALKHFFQKDTLLQLRELALREVANQVERQIGNAITPSQKETGECFIACISTNEKAAKRVIRKTARLSNRFDAEWYVVYVQTPREATHKIDLAAQRHLINNFQMATELGGIVQQLKSADIAEALSEFAKSKNATLVVCAQSRAHLLKKLFHRDLIHRLLHRLTKTEIDLFIANY